MAGLSTLSPNTTTISALSNIALVIPNIVGLFSAGASPQNTIGYQPQNPTTNNGEIVASQKALLFHYEGEQTVALESDITDNFIEDNTAIQDQIALKPEIITTHGFIGELNDVPPFELAVLQAASSALTVVGAYVPGLSTTALLRYSEAFQLYQVNTKAFDSSVSAISSLTENEGTSVINGGTTLFKKISHQNKQQSMFQQFYGYWRNRVLFTVQTPWAVFQNCAIQSLRAIQDSETQVITDFEVKFKLIRMANTVTGVTVTNGRFTFQSAPNMQNGTQTPVQTPGTPGAG